MKSNSLIESLFQNPEQFEFFQAVQLLEQFHTVCFSVPTSLSFPANEIKKITALENNTVDMQVNFMGLTGPSGVLPDHYTELLISRSQAKDNALRDFLDVFHHRTINLFYQAWKKYHVASDAKPLIQIISALVGQEGSTNPHLPLEIFLFYSGYFARKVRSAVMLENMLTDYFDLPVVVQQFQSERLFLKSTECTRLTDTQNVFSQLGITAVLGEAVWSKQYKFRICIGPLSYETFLTLLPNTHKLMTLISLTCEYVGREFNFDIQLILKANEVPVFQLHQQAALRLGWNMWLRNFEFNCDVGDAVFSK